jgi:hypothetical protein
MPLIIWIRFCAKSLCALEPEMTPTQNGGLPIDTSSATD